MSSLMMKKKRKMHGNKTVPAFPFYPFSPLPSFFKIMIGDFEQAMFIPPKFAQTLERLVDREMYLEDSMGICWMVKLRKMDGSLAFEQGWHDFVSDHFISSGEILIFRHISISLFSVHIYGTSGSERVHFEKKENNNNNRRKRTEKEITPDILRLKEAQKNSEASQGKHNAVDQNAEKKDGEFDGYRKFHDSLEAKHHEAPSNDIDLDDIMVVEAGRSSPIVVSDDDDTDTDTEIRTKDDSFHHVDRSRELQKTSSVKENGKKNGNGDASKRSTSKCLIAALIKSSMESKDSVHKQEAVKFSPTTECPDPSRKKVRFMDLEKSVIDREKQLQLEKTLTVEHDNDREGDLAACNSQFTISSVHFEALQSKENSQDVNRFGATNPTCDKCENKTETELNRAIVPHSHTTKNKHQHCFNTNSRLEPNKVSDKLENGDQIVSKVAVDKFVVTEKGICYTDDNEFKDELGQSKDASVDFGATQSNCKALDDDEVGPKSKSSSPLEDKLEVSSPLHYDRDDQRNPSPSYIGDNNCNHSKGNLGNESTPPLTMIEDTTVKGSPLNREGGPFKSGKVPDKAPEVDAEKDIPCQKGGGLPAVKKETIDPSDVISLNCDEFRITVSIISQSWLLLPERLPARLLRKRCDRKVVLLQDPSTRLWPALYHESLNFIGFVAGWEEFTAANDLQPGDPVRSAASMHRNLPFKCRS